LLSEELESIEALLGDGKAINSDGRWDSDLARLMVRLRFHQARIKHRMALVGALPTNARSLGKAHQQPNAPNSTVDPLLSRIGAGRPGGDLYEPVGVPALPDASSSL
jgi:hypothetical protein